MKREGGSAQGSHYKILIPFLIVQLCDTFEGELEMRQKGPDRI